LICGFNPQLARRILRNGEQALHAGRDLALADHEARVVLGNDRRLRVIVLQNRKKRRGRGRGPCHQGQSVEEITPGHAAVRITVKKIDDLLVHEKVPPNVHRQFH
jgi:hypothetical protein